jgi:2,3-bisphosphoglycerate-independent phosphoglycerate mutase
MINLEKKPVTLIILDGFGVNAPVPGNAVEAAVTPNIDRYCARYPHTLIRTSGMDVGLPTGQMGNSEVGHTNIGAGRIVYQELTRITKSIEDGDFFENPALSGAVQHAKNNGTALHLFGLLSDGGVHSHNTHLYALLRLAARNDLKEVYVHCLYDGRDVPPDSAKGFTEELVAQLAEIGTGRIASVMGRYYAMDRDNRWDRVSRAYNAMVEGKGTTATDPVAAVAASYEAGIMDEFIAPTVIIKNGKPVGQIKPNDSVICFNFRPDRAREITRALIQPDFTGFERPQGALPLYYVTMTQYDKTFAAFPNLHVAYKPENLDNTFGAYIAEKGLTQLRIAETEKYAHVTFFFNGGVEKAYQGEDRCLVPSPKVATYDQQPEMSAFPVAEEAVERVKSGKYDVIILNFANCDMVGHTGFMAAAVKAVEAVDACFGKVADAVLAQGGIVLLTADHGNAEQMIDPETGGPFTAHTTFPVPLLIAGVDGLKAIREGRLADLAPTMLDLMGLEKPGEMTGESLLSY